MSYLGTKTISGTNPKEWQFQNLSPAAVSTGRFDLTRLIKTRKNEE